MASKKVAKKVAKKAVKKAPKGYHRMPNGKLMEGEKHEKRESKAEQMREYGRIKRK
jgi:hypothetical protein